MEDFSRRTITLSVIGLLVAAILTIAGVYAIIDQFVVNHNDPIQKAGGLKPSQKTK